MPPITRKRARDLSGDLEPPEQKARRLAAENINLPPSLGDSHPMGINNPGNWCYLNAYMQGFLRHPRVCAFFMREHEGSHVTRPYTCPGCRVRDLVYHLRETRDQDRINDARTYLLGFATAPNDPHVPSRFQSLTTQGSWHGATEQQDAHEWGRYLNEWLRHREGRYDQVLDNLVRVQVDVMRVCSCGQQRTRANFEDGPTLELDFPEAGANQTERLDLKQLLKRKFTKTNIQNRCGAAQCPAQNEEGTAEQFLVSTPDMLVIHLNRFTFNLQTKRYEKDVRNIRLYTTLNLARYFNPDKASAPTGQAPASVPAYMANYKLYAVLKHSGTLNAGHYITSCLHRGRWYEINDDDVSLQPQGEALGHNPPSGEQGKSGQNFTPYLLFYRREPYGEPDVQPSERMPDQKAERVARQAQAAQQHLPCTFRRR